MSARFHPYVAKKFGAMAEEISLGDSSNCDEGNAAIGSHQWEIPCLEFESFWETLIFDNSIKNEVS